MRKILIIGAGQAGLQLALGLQSNGYEVTLMSNRTADEIRGGRIMSTQCMFHTALQNERDIDANFWENQAPKIQGLGVSVAAPDHSRAVNWLGLLSDGFAQSVDQRVKMAGWMETFAQRGGRLVIHGAAVSDLDFFAKQYDLVLVAAGKGELVSMFERDAERSPYDTPQRALAVAYVQGMEPRPEHADTEAVRCNLIPGVGELFIMPTITTSGRADTLFWEGIPGGPLDVFQNIKDPGEHLAVSLDLLKTYLPWEYERCLDVELSDANATLAGRYAPTVRKPIGHLPSGGAVLGVADVVVANDPVTGQGSNSASKCAATYLASILERGDEPFDEEWMQQTFDRYWDTARHVVRWTNAMLAPPPEHVLNIIGAAGEVQAIADRFADGFNDPSDFDNYFFDAKKAEDYLASFTAGV